MAPINILVMIHGITPNKEPSSPFEKEYEPFWQRLVQRQPDLPHLVTRRIGVQWGHAMPLDESTHRVAQAWSYQREHPDTMRDDERLTGAQANVVERVMRDAEQFGCNLLLWLIGPAIQSVRRRIILQGLSDAVYYCAEDGEGRVRRVVYDQILGQMERIAQIDAATDVRLHIVAHSLGVTIAHDFLYGLFRSKGEPTYADLDDATGVRYKKWHERAQQGSLRLGSFSAFASQLPILLMRKQKLVDILHGNGTIDPQQIGIDPGDPQVRWLIFYDRNDLLGFPTQSLYEPCAAIADCPVEVSIWPHRAHTDYWQNATVVERSAALIAAHCS